MTGRATAARRACSSSARRTVASRRPTDDRAPVDAHGRPPHWPRRHRRGVPARADDDAGAGHRGLVFDLPGGRDRRGGDRLGARDGRDPPGPATPRRRTRTDARRRSHRGAVDGHPTRHRPHPVRPDGPDAWWPSMPSATTASSFTSRRSAGSGRPSTPTLACRSSARSTGRWRSCCRSARPSTSRLDSLDVNHSFYVPAFLFKRDAIPGSPTKFDLQVTAPGIYPGTCAEFCGVGHSRMPFTIRGVDPGDLRQLARPAAGRPRGQPALSVSPVP